MKTAVRDILLKLDSKIDALDAKLDNKVDALDSKLSTKIDKLQTEVTDINLRLTKVETRSESLVDDIKEIKGSQKAQIWTLIGILTTAIFGFIAALGRLLLMPLN